MHQKYQIKIYLNNMIFFDKSRFRSTFFLYINHEMKFMYNHMKNEIFESQFYKDLVNNPKPYTLTYFKKWGPIVTHQNLNTLLEKLMIDYLMKKNVISMYYDKYDTKRSDYEQMEMFEKELLHRLGQRPLKIDFLTIIPDGQLKEQFDKILTDPDFECFMI